MSFLGNLFGTKTKDTHMKMGSSAMKGHGAMPATKEIDPVCGMEVDPNTASAKSEYMGKTCYFCSPGCKRTFDANPQKYMGSATHAMSGHGGHMM